MARRAAAFIRLLAAAASPLAAKRLAAAAIAAVALLLGSAATPRATADEPTLSRANADLKSVLEKGLKARRPEEFAFVRRVVERVEDGSVPVSLVKSTFLWARQRQPYPVVYFERAMRVRAKKLGITL